MQPNYPQTPPQQPSMQVGKVSNNPFKHFVKGNKALFSKNALAALLTCLASAVASIIITIASLYLVLNVLVGSIFSFSGNSSDLIGKLVLGLIVVLVIAVVLTSITYIAMLHTLVTAVRGQKVTALDAFNYAIKNLIPSITANLAVYGLFIAVYAANIIINVAIQQPALAIFSTIATFIFIIVFAFRTIYVELILADDTEHNGALGTIKRSALLWKKSAGAVVLYILMIFVVVIVLSGLTSNKSTSTSTYSSSSRGSLTSNKTISTKTKDTLVFSEIIGSYILSTTITSLLALVGAAGIASIYNDTKQNLGNAPLNSVPVGMGPKPLDGAGQPYYNMQMQPVPQQQQVQQMPQQVPIATTPPVPYTPNLPQQPLPTQPQTFQNPQPVQPPQPLPTQPQTYQNPQPVQPPQPPNLPPQ